jgi:hypothetical protein
MWSILYILPAPTTRVTITAFPHISEIENIPAFQTISPQIPINDSLKKPEKHDAH